VPEDRAKIALRSAIAALKARLASSQSSPEQVHVQLAELQRVSLELEARIDLARPARYHSYSNCGEYFSVDWILLKNWLLYRNSTGHTAEERLCVLLIGLHATHDLEQKGA